MGQSSMRLGAGIVLLLQTQQHDVAGVAGGEAGDLEVVVHQPVGLRERVVLAGEELLLVVVIGTPGEHASRCSDASPRIWRIMSFGSTPSVGFM